MSGRTIFAVLAGASLFAQAAQAAEPNVVTLEPTSKWALDYGEENCRMARIFGEGDDRTILLFHQNEPSDDLEWTVAGETVAKFSGNKMTVRFGPGSPSFETVESVTSTFEGFGPAVRSVSFREGDKERDERFAREKAWGQPGPVGLPVLAVEDGQAIEWLDVSRGNRHLRLNTGNLGSVFAAMNKCMEDLVVFWGADPAILKQRATKPHVRNLQRVADEIVKFYPREAESSGRMADYSIRVMVEADGSVSKCFTRAITKAEGFGTNACQTFVKLADFEPARDAKGQPLPSFYMTTIRYRLN